MKKISFISIIFIIYLTIIGMIVSSKISIKQEEAVFKKIDISVDAESCIVMNSKNEIIYAKNEHKKLLPASITKILTCLTSLKLYPLDHYVYITYDMVNTIGSKIYLKEGDFIKIEDLLYGLMLSSGNDASKTLELALSNNSTDFIYYMNKFAKEIGMKNSYFNNSSGLDNESLNYTTSYDMAILTNYAIKYNSFVKIYGAKKHTARLTDRMLYFRHKHRLVHNIPNIIGGKTGVVPIFCVI